MNKILKKIAIFVLIALIIIPFTSCKDTTADKTDSDPIVMTYKDKSITASEFGFYLASYKAKFSQVYADFEDTNEFYNSTIDGVNAEEYLFSMVIQNVKRSLISEALYYEHGLEMDDALVGDIEYYIDYLIYENFSDDDEAFNKAINKLGITAYQLRNIYLRDEMTYELLKLLAEEKTEIGASDAAMQEYLETNYSRICHIYVNNKYTYLTDSNGNSVYDSEGKLMTVEMTGKELQTKNALVAAIDESLAVGGDFIEIYDAFSEDKYYKNGYYLTKNTQFIDEIVDAAFTLEVGQWVKIETSVGTHYVMRLEMDNKPWTDSANSDFLSTFEDTVISELFGEYLDSFADEVTVNEEALEGFNLRTSPSNYIF